MIYLDNAATTKVAEDVFAAMKPYFCEQYANPSAIYTFAGKAMKAVDAARKSVAELIGAQANEIYFTAGGSEADNWAVKAAAETYKAKGKHIITSTIEHHAVLHTCQYLEKQGYEVTYVNVDEHGVVKLDELAAAVREDTVLISIMAENNEMKRCLYLSCWQTMKSVRFSRSKKSVKLPERMVSFSTQMQCRHTGISR